MKKTICSKVNFAVIFSLISICSNAQINSYPYSENFDSGNGNWSVSTLSGTSWELGLPSAPGSPAPFSMPNCWGTDLDSGYRAGSSSYLTSPWFITGTLVHPYFSFHQFRYMSVGLDGMHVEYTLNDSIWNLLGSSGTPWGNNWYNTTSIFATGLAGFTGNSNGWMYSGIHLDYMGQIDSIRFRFKFSSNTSFGSAQPGVFIDNVTLKDSILTSTDLSLNSVYSPSTNVTTGISQPVQVVVSNISFQQTDTIDFGYSLNGLPYTTTQIISTLTPGQTDTFTIGNISVSQSLNTLCVYIHSPGDNNALNDSSCIAVNGITTIPLPYFENFESGPGSWSQVSNPNTLWEYGTPNYLATSSAHSGSFCWDINLNTAYFPNAYSVLYSPVFDVSSAGLCRLSFWRNNNSEASWDGTRIEYSLDNGVNWLLLGNVSDPYATNWYNYNTINSSGLPAWAGSSGGWIKSSYILQQLAGQSVVQFRYLFTSDASVQTDGISIDDFSIQEIPPFDAELLRCYTYQPSYPLGGTSDSVYFLVKNNGSQPFNNFTYTYSLNGVMQSVAVNIGNLQPLDTILISLPGFAVNLINSTICGKIVLANDADTTNNNLCFSTIGSPIYTPTFDDNFDNGNLGWYNENAGSPGTEWELGTPFFGATTGTYSPPSCWDINLSSGYANSAMSILYSPYFDLSNAVHPTINFWQNRNTETPFDGLRLEYRNSGDTTWQTMGTYLDPAAINWYNALQLSSSLKPGWTGNSSGWINSIFNLDSLNLSTLIQLRFVFTSDIFGGSDGVSIDNFKITTIYSNDAALLNILTPGANAIQGVSTPVEVLLSNRGSLPLTNLTISYRLNNGAPVTFNWNGILLTDSSQLVSLPAIFPIGGPNTLEIYIDWGGDQYNANDTINTSFFGIVTAGLPYSYDFDAGSNGWSANTGPGNTNWELGFPNFGLLNSTHSGNACWDINLSLPYFNLAAAELTSPIFDLSPYQIITLQFWLNYASESNADGLFIEYSTNGTTWQRLGTINDPLGSNWYNSTLYQNHQGWSGVSNGWQSCSYTFFNPWGNNFLQLRFKFISDFNVSDAGFSLDDINITGTTGVGNVAGNQIFSIFPNPANESVEILIKQGHSPDMKIDLFSLDGRLIHSTSPLNNKVYLNLQAVPDGCYICRLVDSSEKPEFIKLIVRH